MKKVIIEVEDIKYEVEYEVFNKEVFSDEELENMIECNIDEIIYSDDIDLSYISDKNIDFEVRFIRIVN
jgi:hypothetical protein